MLFLTLSVLSQEYDSCYQIVRFYVCWRLFLLHFGVTIKLMGFRQLWFVARISFLSIGL